MTPRTNNTTGASDVIAMTDPAGRFAEMPRRTTRAILGAAGLTLASMALLACTAGLASAAAPTAELHARPVQSTSSSSPAVLIQANTTSLWLYSAASGGSDQHLGLMAGTSPSAATLSNGGVVGAFQANTGYLWIYGADGTYDTGLGMQSGTSPSIAVIANGTFEVAAQANTGILWTYAPSTGGRSTGLGMQAGTSPAITGLSNGSYEVAAQANTGILWSYSPSTGGTSTGLGMAVHTDPSITTLSSGGYEVAAQSNTGMLWVYTPSSGGVEKPVGMAANTSPSLIALANGGCEIAVQANTGILWTYTAATGGVSTGLGMAPGTSPSMAATRAGLSGTWGKTVSHNAFPAGQCTWGAEYEFNQFTGTYIDVLGNANQWAASATSNGWTVVSSPRVDSIAVLQAGVDGASQYGHVGWVLAVSGSQIELRDMNWGENGQWNTHWINEASGISYILVP